MSLVAHVLLQEDEDLSSLFELFEYSFVIEIQLIIMECSFFKEY